MSGGLTAFLTARLGEVEAAANAAASVAGPDWTAETYYPEDGSRARTCVRSASGAFLADFDYAPDYPDLAAHVALNDPGSVLRDVATWRRLLLEYSIPPGTDAKYGGTERETGFRLALSFALKAKAAEWKDHPDYPEDGDWAP